MWLIKSEPEEYPKDSANNNMDRTDNNVDSTDNNVDCTNNSTKISDTKKISNEDENEIFDNYSFGRFIKFNYFVQLFISTTIQQKINLFIFNMIITMIIMNIISFN